MLSSASKEIQFILGEFYYRSGIIIERINNTDLYLNLLNKFTPFFIDFHISIGIIPRYLLGKLTPNTNLWFIMPQKIIKLTMVNADIEIKEQTEYSESMRHLIT